MRFIRNYITFSLFFILIILCQESTAQKVVKVSKTDFPEKMKIKGQEILTQDYNHHHIIFVLDTLLLTMVNSGENHYHVFHKDKLNYLGAVGVRGDGPDQWEIPATTVGQFKKTSEGIKLWQFDYLRGTYSLINLTKTLKSKSSYPVVERRLRINVKIFPYFQLFMGGNDKLYANSWIYEQNRSRLKSFDQENNKIVRSGLFPKIKNNTHLPSEVMNSLYGASLDKHPSQDKFVQATFIFNRIDIFDENLQVIKSIVDGDNWKDDYYDGKDIDPAVNFINPRTNGFNGLATGEKYIYALEAKLNFRTDKFRENESFVRVYDWEGRPKAYLEVAHDLSSIDIDEKSGMLYATDYSHELVLKFDISQLMKKW